MKNKIGLLHYIKNTWTQFSDDHGFMMAAALSYYTLFSIAPLLIIVITLLGFVVESQDLENALFEQLGGIMGYSQANELKSVVENAKNTSSEVMATIISSVTLLITSTAVVIHLKDVLNRAWNVIKDPSLGFKAVVLDRIFSLGFLLALGFIFLVSMGLNTVATLLSNQVAYVIPEIGETAVVVTSSAIGLIVTFLMFYLLFRFLPDARLKAKDLIVGAAVTTIMFSIGRYAIGYYLGYSDIGSTFGGAGALASFMIWVYYNAIILIIGAEFTQVYALAHDRNIYPSKQSLKVERVIKKQSDGSEL